MNLFSEVFRLCNRQDVAAKAEIFLIEVARV